MPVMSCKIKNFLALVISVSLTSLIFLCFFVRDQHVDIQNLVSQTHKQLMTLQENFPYRKSTEQKLEVEDKYLKLLGFNREITSNPPVSHGSSLDATDLNLKEGTLPVVIVSAITKEELNEEEDFIRNVESTFPTNPIVIWNLETTSTAKNEETDFSIKLKQLCNSTKCWVERFSYDDYPEHVRDHSIHAYRPLIIQTMLDRGVCVLWLDIGRRLLPLGKGALGEFLKLAIKGGSEGIVGWSAENPGLDSHVAHPTSTLTHPKMLTFFDADVEDYYFHRMIDPAHLLVCNTETVHSKVMLPWIKCTLTKECISPFGAQSGGCRFDKKPLYRYSGCHAYDSSALNVVLGIAFPLHQPYIARSAISRPSNPIAANLTTTSN